MQKLIQTEELQQVQRQQLTAQQLLQVRLLEMPLTQLEQAVQAEIDDNPALETADMGDYEEREERNGEGTIEGEESGDSVLRDEQNDSFEEQTEREERQDALDAALESIGADDMMEIPSINTAHYTDSETTYNEARSDTSFYDILHEQVGELSLNDMQKDVMEYLIGSLDTDGLLRKSVEQIADEMAVFLNIDVSEEVIREVLAMLQTFDPPGVGATSLQDCLLIQIKKRREEKEEREERREERKEEHNDNLLLEQMERVLTRYFTPFIKNQWSRISAAMHLTEEETEALRTALRRLNPKPGAALGESQARSTQHVTPDFIVDDDGNGNLSIHLNRGQLPELYISPAFTDMLKAYRSNRQGMNRATKEALLYSKEKVERAKGFINAIQQRNHTLLNTMQTIVDWQRTFFLEGDNSTLRPMILKDIAAQTHLNISTISRVCAGKYVQTRWGIFPLRHFFSDVYTTDEGEALSKHEIKDALRSLIEHEDPHHPLSDDALQAAMKAQGYPIARRTIAKYRMQMNIPVARLRRK